MPQIQKMDKSLFSSKASDLKLKLPNNGEKACAYDLRENAVPVHLVSSYSKQDIELAHSLDF